jgi:hypothetical protein
MNAKFLIVVGIVVAHGALAAGLVHEDPPKQRISAATCVRTPNAMPNITPARELYAMAVIPISNDQVNQP